MVPKSANKIQKSAGILWLYSNYEENKRAVIKAHHKLNFENACPWNESKVLHPIALRPNTNARGIAVSGWLIHQNQHKTEWTLMGRYSPNPNQAFYPIKDTSLVIKQNDWVAMRCTYHNNNTHDIYFGADDSNETCNLYVMYYIDGDDLPESNVCVSFGPPYYSWRTDPNLPGGSVPRWVDRGASRLHFGLSGFSFGYWPFSTMHKFAVFTRQY